MPDVLPSCFGDYHVSSTSSANKSANNLVTCLYKAKLAGEYRLISVTWCKTLMGQGLSVHVDDPACQLTCNVDMKPWHFWKKQGCKTFDVTGLKVEVIWDLSCAKYVSGPEPYEGYYVAIVCDESVVLFLGDMKREALNKKVHEQTATLLSRREHVTGKESYLSRAQFSDTGQIHDIVIECNAGMAKEPRLSIRVDKQVVVQVKRLLWKFRGNQAILIDGLPILVFWDVHDWLFKSGDAIGHAVFLFQACASKEKPWFKEIGLWPTTLLPSGDVQVRSAKEEGSCGSILHWPNSHSFKNREHHHPVPWGFSLILHALRHD